MKASYGIVQAHFVYCAHYFYYYYIFVTSNHQALDFRVHKPWLQTRDGHNSESIRCDSDKESEVMKVDMSQSENLEVFHIVEDLSPRTFIWETDPFE